MTSRPVDPPATADYLILQRRKLGFLVPRRFCLTSIHFTASIECLAGTWLARGPVPDYRGQAVLLFDLAACLDALFGTGDGPGFPAAFVSDLAVFDPATREQVAAWCALGGLAPPAWVAFHLGQEPRLVRRPRQARHSILASADRLLAGRGLDGCAFPDNQGIEYYLNPEALLLAGLKKAVEHAHSAG